LTLFYVRKIQRKSHGFFLTSCSSFGLLGYDFMIDEDFRVWLIEVNENPYLGYPNEYIANLVP